MEISPVTYLTTEYVLDTHPLIWFLEGNPRLGTQAKTVLSDSSSRFFLPEIALAEACWIVDAGKTSIQSVSDLLAAIDADVRIVLVPMGREIVDLSQELQSVGEMHDRQIVATALHLIGQGHSVALLTKDANITASGLIATVW